MNNLQQICVFSPSEVKKNILLSKEKYDNKPKQPYSCFVLTQIICKLYEFNWFIKNAILGERRSNLNQRLYFGAFKLVR